MRKVQSGSNFDTGCPLIKRRYQGNVMELNKRRKMLIYRANHRGIKEMDIILGKFANTQIIRFDTDRLDDFEAICNENDRDLLQWIMGECPVPSHVNALLFQEIKNFAEQSFN